MTNLQEVAKHLAGKHPQKSHAGGRGSGGSGDGNMSSRGAAIEELATKTRLKPNALAANPYRVAGKGNHVRDVEKVLQETGWTKTQFHTPVYAGLGSKTEKPKPSAPGPPPWPRQGKGDKPIPASQSRWTRGDVELDVSYLNSTTYAVSRNIKK